MPIREVVKCCTAGDDADIDGRVMAGGGDVTDWMPATLKIGIGVGRMIASLLVCSGFLHLLLHLSQGCHGRAGA